MERIKKEPGIYPGVTYEEYSQWDAINNTVLWKLKSKSPMHCKEYLDNPPEPTDALRIGGAMHIRILEPHLFDERYIVAPKVDRRTKVGKATWAAFQETLKGRECLTQAEFDSIDLMHKRLKEQDAYQYVTGRDPDDTELAIVWNDEATGILCKAKIDYARRDAFILCDLKSTGDCSEHGFRRSIEKYGYYQQAAFYCDGWQALTGDAPSFLFIAMEKTPPYCCCSYEPDDWTLQAGRNSYREALKLWKDCVDNDNWPGYNDGKVSLIQVSRWLLEAEGVGRDQVVA